MLTETDIAYIAGIVDGEGHIGVKKAQAYRCQGRRTPGYHARIAIRMVDEGAIRFLAETLGGWYWKEKVAAPNRRILYAYQSTDADAERILRIILPHLRVKRAVAEAVLSLRALQAQGKKHRTKVTGYRNFPNSHGTPRRVANLSFSDEYVAACDAIYKSCKALNRVGV